MGPLHFNVFINYIGAGLECILRQFEDDSTLGGTVDSLKGGKALQRDLDKIRGLDNHELHEVNKSKC